jgi:hypothetical protein
MRVKDKNSKPVMVKNIKGKSVKRKNTSRKSSKTHKRKLRIIGVGGGLNPRHEVMYKDENFTVDEITDIVIRVMEKYKRPRRTKGDSKIRYGLDSKNKRTSHKYNSTVRTKGGMDINNGNNIRRTESEGTEEELGEFTQPQRETLQPHHRIHVDTVLPTPRRVQDPETNRAFRDYFRENRPQQPNQRYDPFNRDNTQETHPPQQDQFTVEPNNTPSPRSQNPVARRMLDDQGEYLPITGTSSPEFSELYERYANSSAPSS